MIGEKIRKIRESKGIGLNELARIIEINASYLSAIERGVKTNPSFEVLGKIADALGVTITSFITDDLNKIAEDSILEEAQKAGIPDVESLDPDRLDDVFDQDAQERIAQKMIEYLQGILRYKKPPKHTDQNIDLSSRRPLGQVKYIPKVGKIVAGMPVLAEENLEGYMPIDTFFLEQDKQYFLLQVKGDSMNLEFQDGTWVLVEQTSCLESGQIGVVLINGYEATVKKVVLNQNMITLIPVSSNPEYKPMMYNLEKDDVRIQGRVIMALKIY